MKVWKTCVPQGSAEVGDENGFGRKTSEEVQKPCARRGVQVKVGERRAGVRGFCALQATKGIRIGLRRQGEVIRGL